MKKVIEQVGLENFADLPSYIDDSDAPKKSVLESLADLAEKASKPIGRIPMEQAQIASLGCKAAAVTLREVDGEVDEVKAAAQEAAKSIRKRLSFLDKFDLDFEREILPR